MKGWCGHSVFVVERYGSSWKTGCGVSFFFKWATFITPLCSAARSSVGRALAGHFSRYAGFFTCFWGLLGFLHRVRLSAVIRGYPRILAPEGIIRGFNYNNRKLGGKSYPRFCVWDYPRLSATGIHMWFRRKQPFWSCWKTIIICPGHIPAKKNVFICWFPNCSKMIRKEYLLLGWKTAFTGRVSPPKLNVHCYFKTS